MEEVTKDEAYRRKVKLYEALAELESKEKDMKSSQDAGKLYLLAIMIPVAGIYYSLKYLLFSGGDRDKMRTGAIILALTLVSLFLSFWMTASFLKTPFFALPASTSREILNLYK